MWLLLFSDFKLFGISILNCVISPVSKFLSFIDVDSVISVSPYCSSIYSIYPILFSSEYMEPVSCIYPGNISLFLLKFFEYLYKSGFWFTFLLN